MPPFQRASNAADPLLATLVLPWPGLLGPAAWLVVSQNFATSRPDVWQGLAIRWGAGPCMSARLGINARPRCLMTAVRLRPTSWAMLFCC